MATDAARHIEWAWGAIAGDPNDVQVAQAHAQIATAMSVGELVDHFVNPPVITPGIATDALRERAAIWLQAALDGYGERLSAGMNQSGRALIEELKG